MMQARPRQRLLLQGVMATTFQLVRCVRDEQAPARVQGLIGERRRMLAELAKDMDIADSAGPLSALRAAVAESDRTLEAIIG